VIRPASAPPPVPGEQHRTVASASILLVLRRGLTLITAGLSTALLSRLLGAPKFGELQVGLAVWTFATGTADLGFSQVLGRELVLTGRARARLLRTGYQVQGAWALGTTAVLAVVGLLEGAGTTRGQVLLVLCPSVAATGVAAGRAVLMAMDQYKVLVRTDIVFNLALSVGMVLAALAGGGPLAVAAVFSACTAANSLALGLLGQRRAGVAPARPQARRDLLRQVLPLGVVSLFGKVYLSMDLILLGWLSTDDQAGQYGGAVRIIATLNTVVAVVMTAALPALARARSGPEAFAALASKLLGWLVLGALPMFVVVGALSGPVARVALGPGYEQAGRLTAVLALSGVVATLSQLLGTILISASVVRQMVYQNAVAAVVNVTGNVILLPRYGAAAAAWLTLATEVLVCAGALLLLPGALPRARLLAGAWRPAAAVVAGAGVLLALHRWPLPGLAAGGLAYAAVVWWLRCWPAEFTPARRLIE